jgi:poly(3-hydroxybutyrate) depolymerase
VVLVSEPGLPVSQLEEMSALFDVNPGWIHVGVDPLVGPGELGGVGIPDLLEETVTSQCVDLNRVFVVGFGEGGLGAGEAACTAPRLITGAAMVAGWAEPTCSPDPRVSVRIVGSDDDPAADTGTAFEEVGGAWAEAMGAGEQTVDGRDEETLVRSWHGPGGATVETTAMVAGGHTWTLSASLAVGAFLGDTARSLD